MDRAREEAARPESRLVGRLALAEVWRTFGLGEPASGVATPPTADLRAESLERPPARADPPQVSRHAARLDV